MARLNVSVVATGIPEEVNKYKIVFLKLQKPKNIWTKKMSCRQFLERGCPQPSGSPPFPGSASIRQVISSTQDNTLPHTEAKATFFLLLPVKPFLPESTNIELSSIYITFFDGKCLSVLKHPEML